MPAAKRATKARAKQPAAIVRRPVPMPPLSLPETVEKVLIAGDLAPLKPEERVDYYKKVCLSLRLNPLTRPFDYILFSEPGGGGAKLSLYANKSCAEQLRKMHGVSVLKSERVIEGDCVIYDVTVSDRTGRTDSAAGVVPLFKFKDGRRINLEGREWANAVMKAHTKAKRRATLSICGLAFLDESELDGIEVLGGVTEGGRVYRYPQIEEGSKEAAQAVAERKIAEHKAKEVNPGGTTSGSDKEATGAAVPESETRPVIELDWSEDETSPIVRGDIAPVLELMQKHMHMKWAGDWWHCEPRDEETLRQMCEQLGYEVRQILPSKSSGADRPPEGPQPPQRAAAGPSTGGTSSDGPTVVFGGVNQVVPSKTLKGAPARNVKISGCWHKCYRESLFEYIDPALGLEVEFLVDAKKTIVGIKRIAGRQFDADSLPIIDRNEERNGKLF